MLTANPGLLIFDNAEDVATVRRCWPASTRGCYHNHFAESSVFQHYQSRDSSSTHDSRRRQCSDPKLPEKGGSEQESAQMLSVSVGGLPLAIAHFSGLLPGSSALSIRLAKVLRIVSRQVKSGNLEMSCQVVPTSSL